MPTPLSTQSAKTLESAARAAEAHRALPHLAGWALRAADALRRRWPDADLDLTDRVMFPPYSPRRNGGQGDGAGLSATR